MRYADLFSATDCTALEFQRAYLPDGKPKGVSYATISSGGSGTPQIHLNRYDPHWVENRHRHVEDEVLIMIEGDITIEGVRHIAPTVIFVGRHTLYGPLEAGSQGATFYRVAYNEKLLARVRTTAADVAI